MTVKELIKYLKQIPPDVEVALYETYTEDTISLISCTGFDLVDLNRWYKCYKYDSSIVPENMRKQVLILAGDQNG